MNRVNSFLILLVLILFSCKTSKNNIKLKADTTLVYETDPRKKNFQNKEEIYAWAKKGNFGEKMVDSFSFSISVDTNVKNVFIVCSPFGSGIISNKVYVFEDNKESWPLKLETDILTRKVIVEKTENKIIFKSLKNEVFLELPFRLFSSKIER